MLLMYSGSACAIPTQLQLRQQVLQQSHNSVFDAIPADNVAARIARYIKYV